MKFGDWMPDLPPNAHEGLVIARNTYASPNGYRPLNAQTPITTALEGINGGAAYLGSDGTTAILGGTVDALYRYTTDWNSVFATGSSGPWRFAQFGDNVISVDGGAPVSYDIIAGTAASLGGTPPNASLVATVRDFVWLAGDPNNRQTLSISGYNDSTGWTPGTNQSTEQTFPDGGSIMGLASGEYGLILQRYSIKRGSYIGDGVVNWQFDEISANVGCIAQGSVAQAGRLVFFLSERGFMVCDGNDVKPIGNERVDLTFFSSYERSDLDKMTAAIDPRRFLVIWAMPGSPGRLWIYNWALDKWTDAVLPISVAFSSFTANVPLEALDALYPDGLDSIPVSLDSALFAGGDPLLLVADDLGAAGPLSGDALVARFLTGNLELSPGRVTKIANTLPMTDASQILLTFFVHMRLNDEAVEITASEFRPSGHMPIRASGRFFQLGMRVSGNDWTFAQGVDLTATAAEVR